MMYNAKYHDVYDFTTVVTFIRDNQPRVSMYIYETNDVNYQLIQLCGIHDEMHVVIDTQKLNELYQIAQEYRVEIHFYRDFDFY